jgi:serine phosphatase RsbU (regulator of sigma subunit)
MVLAVSVLLVATASVLANNVHRHTEQRLLQGQAKQAAAVLAASVGSVEAILAPAAELAAANEGDPSTFESSLGSSIPARFVSASLWIDGVADPVVVGEPPAIAGDASAVAAMRSTAAATQGVTVSGIVGDPAAPRLGYQMSAARDGVTYVVHVETALPTPQRGYVSPDADGAFSNLEYALYLDDSQRDEVLLWSSVEELPLTGRRATATVTFENAVLLLVVTPAGVLSGGLSRALPWLVGLVGITLSAGFAALTERLLRRRDDEVATSASLALLSQENERLYSEQRGIAETLQRSLLPDHLPSLARGEVTARYWPAGTASEVGGDFYDVFELGAGRWGLAIGDVCGKGVDAAALTGVARHTIQAAARHVERPSEVLRWVHEAIRSKNTTMFCTVCFGVLTVPPSGPVRIDLALGGHPPPLLCRRDGTSEEIGVVGTVLGIIEPTVTDTSYELDAGDTLVLFTDGLTDAPQGTAVRIEDVEGAHAADPQRTPDRIADHIQELIERRRPLGSGDDTALLVIRIDDGT